MRQVARLDLDTMGLPSFLTLTYPAEFPSSGPITKAHLHAFEQALNREFGSPFVVWKLEFQHRGAPHYHMLVWGITPGWRERTWLSETWYRIVGSGDPKHLRAGTQWNLCYSWRQVASYTAKYLGKVQGIPAGFLQVGRLWGLWNEAKRAEQAVSDEVPQGGFHLLRRVMRRWANRGRRRRFHVRSRSRWHGLTVLLSEQTSVRLMAWAWGNAWETFTEQGARSPGGER